MRSIPSVTLSRDRDALDVAWSYEKYHNGQNMSDEQRMANLVIDLSQCPSRLSWCRKIRSVTTNSSFYLFAQNRRVSSAEHLRLLGIPLGGKEDRLSEFKARQLRDLAGEAFPGPSVALILAALVMATHRFADLADL